MLEKKNGGYSENGENISFDDVFPTSKKGSSERDK